MIIMLLLENILRATLAASTIPRVAGVPLGNGIRIPRALSSGPSPGPPGAAGSLYGSASLAGHDGNPVDRANSAVVTNYDLVPGQKEEADLGLYLDLNKVQNPQPVRGSNGGTDPGPSPR